MTPVRRNVIILTLDTGKLVMKPVVDGRAYIFGVYVGKIDGKRVIVR